MSNPMNQETQTNNVLICKAIKKDGCKCKYKVNSLYGLYCGTHKKQYLLEQEAEKKINKKKEREEADKQLKALYDAKHPIHTYKFYSMTGKNYEIETNNNTDVEKLTILIKQKYNISIKTNVLMFVEGEEHPLYNWSRPNKTDVKYFIVEQLRTDLIKDLTHIRSDTFITMIKHYIYSKYKLYKITKKIETSTKETFEAYYNNHFVKQLEDKAIFQRLEDSIYFWTANHHSGYKKHVLEDVKETKYRLLTRYGLKSDEVNDLINIEIRAVVKSQKFEEYEIINDIY